MAVEVVVAADAPEVGAPLVDAVLAALCGDALDPSTGTVTMRSLGTYLADRVPDAAIQRSAAAQTVASPPPLAGLWDVRRSQLSAATRSRSRRAAGDADELTGTVLPGRFRLDLLLARGTFGAVYRAHQLAVERDVAVKVLHGSIDPASEDGRLFVQEIRVVGRLDHPNVVRIHQADITHDGRLFYAMELLEGRDLQQLIADGPLPKARAIELVRQLLAGLGAAHDAGLVHADVKPANAIVVRRDGVDRVVLVDFGLARLRAPGATARSSRSAGRRRTWRPSSCARPGSTRAATCSPPRSCWSRCSPAGAGPTRARSCRRSTTSRIPSCAPCSRARSRSSPASATRRAAELAAALAGSGCRRPSPDALEPVTVLPFRLFAPLTEADRERLFGREDDIAALTEHVLYRRSLIYTAPSGTGKTSLLRAGLVPRLEALGVRALYIEGRGVATPAALAARIAPGAASVADAVAEHHRTRRGKLVLLLDQLELAEDLVPEALGFARWPADADVSVVLSIREDHLARLVARAQQLEPGIAIMRLAPLGLPGARAAITGPLAEARLAIEPALLDALLADLARPRPRSRRRWAGATPRASTRRTSSSRARACSPRSARARPR